MKPDSQKNGLKRIYSIVFSVAVAVFILSASIAVPLLNRGLYYLQVDRLGIKEQTGYSDEVIRGAFEEMMDYCTKGGENGGQVFGTGSLKWSESGKAHFDDVEKLFSLDLNLLKISSMLVIIMIAGMVVKKERYEIALGRGALFWGPVVLASGLGIIGVIGATDFDKTFETFHHIFFPGKTNWIFYENEDEIIKILPQEVFMNYAILIVALVIILSIISIVADILIGRRGKRIEQEAEEETEEKK